MGKTTRFHPVSLYVIRASAQWVDFTFGRIKQLWCDPDRGVARYEAEIKSIPYDLGGASDETLMEALQIGFLDDVEVHWVHRTKKGILMCHLYVTLSKQPVPENETIQMVELGWLNDDPEDSTTIEGW